jgi:hypothetical protein
MPLPNFQLITMAASWCVQDKPSSIRCGEDWLWSKKVESGKWYHVRMWLKLNDAGEKNGEFKTWLDGEEVCAVYNTHLALTARCRSPHAKVFPTCGIAFAGMQVLHKTGVRYRYKDSFKISRTYLTTYAGGSVVSMFAPSKDQYIWFDDFKAWTGSDSNGCGGDPSPSPTPRSSPTRSPPRASSPSSPADEPRKGKTGPHGAPRSASFRCWHFQHNVMHVSSLTATLSWIKPSCSQRFFIQTGTAPACVHMYVSTSLRIQCCDALAGLGGYNLVYKDAGWDISGHFKRTQPRRGDLKSNLRDCARDCDRERTCKAFTLNGDICWLKDDVDQKPVFYGKTKTGWRWLYLKK